MLTDAGPSLIEVNGRLGGDMIPYLGMLATGVDPGLVAASAACGLDFPVTPTRRRTAGIRFSYVAEEDTTIDSIAFDTAALPEAVDQAVTVAQPGAVLSPPPKGTVWGRIAYTTAVAERTQRPPAHRHSTRPRPLSVSPLTDNRLTDLPILCCAAISTPDSVRSSPGGVRRESACAWIQGHQPPAWCWRPSCLGLVRRTSFTPSW
jgi:hypothetical protein